MGNRSAVIGVVVMGDVDKSFTKSMDAGVKASDEFKQATKELDDALDQIDKNVKETSRSIDKSSKEFSKGFDGVRDSADNSERRIVGFRDSLTGTQDVMKGLKDGDMVALSTGFADLASSVANLGADMLEWGKKAFEAGKQVVAAHGASAVAKGKDIAASLAHKVATVASTVATGAQTAAQWALNAAMSANPIMLVVIAIAALVAGFVIAWKHSETFREVVTAAFDAVVGAAMWAFNWVKDNWPLLLAILTGPIGLAVLAITRNWDTIKAGVSAVKDWIAEKFTDIVDFITGLPGKIGSAARGMFDGIKEAFRSAVNFIVDGWNGLQFSIPGFDPPGPGPKFGGFTLGVPNLPRLAEGGVTTGPMAAIIGDNPGGREAIIPLNRAGQLGGMVININGPVYGLDDLDRKIADAMARNQRKGF